MVHVFYFLNKIIRKHLELIFPHKDFIICIVSLAIFHPHFIIRIFPSSFYHPHFSIRHPPSAIIRSALYRDPILTGAVTEKWMICISLLKPCGDNLAHIQNYSQLLDDWESSLLDFTLETKLVSSTHLTQVHMKISSRTLQNLASHLMTKYMTWSILFDSKLSHACQNALFDCSAVKSWKMYTVTLLLKST